MRIEFSKRKQKEFLDLVIRKLTAPSLRGLLQFGFDVPYSTLKNYYNESRSLPSDLFESLCEISLIDKKSINFNFVEDNWGKIKGGKISKRRKV